MSGVIRPAGLVESQPVEKDEPEIVAQNASCCAVSRFPSSPLGSDRVESPEAECGGIRGGGPDSRWSAG